MNKKGLVANGKWSLALDDMEKLLDECKIPVWLWLVRNGHFWKLRNWRASVWRRSRLSWPDHQFKICIRMNRKQVRHLAEHDR